MEVIRLSEKNKKNKVLIPKEDIELEVFKKYSGLAP